MSTVCWWPGRARRRAPPTRIGETWRRSRHAGARRNFRSRPRISSSAAWRKARGGAPRSPGPSRHGLRPASRSTRGRSPRSPTRRWRRRTPGRPGRDRDIGRATLRCRRYFNSATPADRQHGRAHLADRRSGGGRGGPEPVVPIIATAAMIAATSRATAFRKLIDRRRALIVLGAAAPTCVLGAYGYTRLTGAGVMILIGTMLALSVPLRRTLRSRGFKLGEQRLGV